MMLKLKPLSVNDVWRGRRFKTPAYKAYEQELFYMLPAMTIPEGKLWVKLVFGFSSVASDLDNPVKPFLDVLQKKYRFNDKKIYKLEIEKYDVEKGEEYVYFELGSVA